MLRPETVLECAKKAGVKLSLGIGLLEQEASRDGKIALNVWGNDRAPNGGTDDCGWDEVTESKYRRYKGAAARPARAAAKASVRPS